MPSKQITLIGGHGLMGKLFTRLLTECGHTLHQIGAKDWADARPILNSSDLVILSVPIHITNMIIAKVAPFLSTECILADFTSIKVEPLLAMLAAHSGPVLGLHPMFGPTIKTTAAQVIICCDGRFPAQYAWFIQDLTKLGFSLKTLLASEHDQAMSFIQGVEHFISFSLGTFLHHKNQHPEQLLDIASPIYLAKLLLLGRIFDQDPQLYADIIMANPARIKLITEFALWLHDWSIKLQQNDKQALITEFKRTAEWMNGFTTYAQRLSDNLLNININKD